MHLAVGAQRLIARIRVDIAVDRDRHVVQVGAMSGKRSHNAARSGMRAASISIVSTPPVWSQAAREMNRRHDDQAWTATVVAASMASSTRGGERQLGESNTGRVAHRVRDRGERRDDRDLADAADAMPGAAGSRPRRSRSRSSADPTRPASDSRGSPRSPSRRRPVRMLRSGPIRCPAQRRPAFVLRHSSDVRFADILEHGVADDLAAPVSGSTSRSQMCAPNAAAMGAYVMRGRQSVRPSAHLRGQLGDGHRFRFLRALRRHRPAVVPFDGIRSRSRSWRRGLSAARARLRPPG